MHPATKFSFTELVEGLQKSVSAGFVTKRSSDGLTIYNYNQKCTYEKAWNEFTIVARGLILTKDRIVAYSFPKFFNYGEPGSMNTIPENLHEAQISEKMDGSLGIVFEYEGKWRVATRGSFESDQAKWALKRLKTERLHPGICFLVEIIYPENKIVIPYDTEKMVLLGAYDSSGKEILDLASLDGPFEIAPKYNFNSLEEVQALCKTLPGDKEGFVIRFSDGSRIKFKGDKYCDLHKGLSGCTPSRVWDALRKCENMKPNLPEEFYDEYDKLEAGFIGKFQRFLDRTESLQKTYQDKTNKEVSQLPISSFDKGWIFKARHPSYLEDVKIAGKLRNNIFDLFKPN